MNCRSLIMLISSLLVLCSCKFKISEQMDKEQPIKVEVSRYDKLQYEFVMTNSFSAIQKMTTDYGQQTRLLVEDVLSIGQVNDVDINNTLREFYSDSLLTKIMCDTEIKYSDLNGINSDLTHAFRVLHKAVPSMKIPHFYAQISALNESIIVDDSIVRGTTSMYIIRMLKEAGAKSVHVRIASPVFKFPSFYGIDMQTTDELMGANNTLDEMRTKIEADSLGFLSVKALVKAIDLPYDGKGTGLTTAYFDGHYPSPIYDYEASLSQFIAAGSVDFTEEPTTTYHPRQVASLRNEALQDDGTIHLDSQTIQGVEA